nr:MAG TPA: hypothetical protein [Caudoviricetes sp.]
MQQQFFIFKKQVISANTADMTLIFFGIEQA